jgi:hypothetical protein
MTRTMTGLRNIEINVLDFNSPVCIDVRVHYKKWTASEDEPEGWEITGIFQEDGYCASVVENSGIWKMIERTFAPEVTDKDDDEIPF